MAIKRRDKPAIDSAAIDSFGEAADAPTPSATVVAVPATKAAPRTVPVAASGTASEWPSGMPKTFLLRYPDPSIPVAIEELQELVGRNKHQTVLLALHRGIDALRREARELGDSADLIK